MNKAIRQFIGIERLIELAFDLFDAPTWLHRRVAWRRF